jgi:hypothetical protein
MPPARPTRDRNPGRPGLRLALRASSELCPVKGNPGYMPCFTTAPATRSPWRRQACAHKSKARKETLSRVKIQKNFPWFRCCGIRAPVNGWQCVCRAQGAAPATLLDKGTPGGRVALVEVHMMSDKFKAFKAKIKDDKFRKKFDGYFFRMIDKASTPDEARMAQEELDKHLSSVGLSVRDLPELMSGQEQPLFEKILRFFEDDVDALIRLGSENATLFFQ